LKLAGSDEEIRYEKGKKREARTSWQKLLRGLGVEFSQRDYGRNQLARRKETL
jgi:hypothetical protein